SRRRPGACRPAPSSSGWRRHRTRRSRRRRQALRRGQEEGKGTRPPGAGAGFYATWTPRMSMKTPPRSRGGAGLKAWEGSGEDGGGARLLKAMPQSGDDSPVYRRDEGEGFIGGDRRERGRLRRREAADGVNRLAERARRQAVRRRLAGLV